MYFTIFEFIIWGFNLIIVSLNDNFYIFTIVIKHISKFTLLTNHLKNILNMITFIH